MFYVNIPKDIEFHRCTEINEFNRKYCLENEEDVETYDKTYIMKDKGIWKLCMTYPIFDCDTEDVEAVPIKFCPYCGKELV